MSPSAEPQMIPSVREAAVARLGGLQAADVLIIGGGVNGAGTLRDLALNGVSAVLIDTGDFCAGASSASSRMAHGGLRYLEGREFRLVAESARERNLLLHDAPHLVRPLEIVVPLETLVSGLPQAMLRFAGLSRRSGPLSLAALEGALALYEHLGAKFRALPRHRTVLKRGAFPAGLDAGTRAVVSYYDGEIVNPEGLIFEMLGEAADAGNVAAVNHITWSAAAGAVSVTDAVSGHTVALRPRVIVNATGAAIDAVNARLGLKTQLVRGVKGAHLVIAHPRLFERMAGRAFYFDDGHGRMVISLPVAGTILMGTTEVETADPGDRGVAGSEVDYLLGALGRLFSDIPVGREHVVAVTSGIRPLQAGGGGNATQAARDHALVEHTAAGRPVISLVGGKWTTFRGFAEQATDCVLKHLGRTRTTGTAQRAYPGAAPVDAAALAGETGLPPARIAGLVARYGALARPVAAFCAAAPDRMLAGRTDYSRREILWLVQARMAQRLDDLVLRRTGLVVTGTLGRETVADMGHCLALALGRDVAWAEAEIARAVADPRILGFAGGGVTASARGTAASACGESVSACGGPESGGGGRHEPA